MPKEDQTGSAKWWRRFSLGRTIFWLALVVPAYMLGWLELVVFVSLLSLWALVETAFAAWRADEQPELKMLIRLAKLSAKLLWEIREEQREVNRKLDILLKSEPPQGN